MKKYVSALTEHIEESDCSTCESKEGCPLIEANEHLKKIDAMYEEYDTLSDEVKQIITIEIRGKENFLKDQILGKLH